MMWDGKIRKKGSFRGVSFEVENGGITAGRRNQIHEYPQRDKSYAEDLGRATREISVTALLVGENALTESERLLEALEAPGPGTLVHPWLGQMQVVAQPSRVSFDKVRGVVQVDFTFVEAGQLAFPSGGVSTSAFSRLQGGLFQTASIADFLENFGIDGFPSFVSDEAVSSLESALGFAGGKFSFLSGFGDGLSGVVSQLAGLVGIPSSLVSSIFDLFSDKEPEVAVTASKTPVLSTVVSSTAASTAATTAQTRASYRYINTLLSAASDPVIAAQPAPSVTLAPSRQQVQNNTNAINALVRQAMLVEAVNVSSTLPPQVFDDVIAVRNDLTKTLDTESLTASDTLYNAITNARIAVHKDLTRRAQDAARLRTVTPPDVTPGLALAYDLYEDAGRVQEIVERNRVIHPGFIPAVDLRVLAR